MYYCKHIPCVGLFIKQQLKPWYNWMNQNQKFWGKKIKESKTGTLHIWKVENVSIGNTVLKTCESAPIPNKRQF